MPAGAAILVTESLDNNREILVPEITVEVDDDPALGPDIRAHRTIDPRLVDLRAPQAGKILGGVSCVETRLGEEVANDVLGSIPIG